MDPIVFGFLFDVSDLLARNVVRGFHLISLNGVSGIPLFLFGSRTTWRIEAQILAKLNEKDAMDFKKSVLDECTMITVASAIVAQIAITALSLNSLSQTHWVARGAFVLSLTSSLMAVYYATTQQRILGRLLQPKQVRLWVRGSSAVETSRLVPSFPEFIHRLGKGFEILFLVPGQSRAEREERLARPHNKSDPTAEIYSMADAIFRIMYNFLPYHNNRIRSDPEDFKSDQRARGDLKRAIINQCFTPSAASVITISAPQMLLSTSLCSLLVGFGVYLGFLSTRSLDHAGGPDDSRKVFITYITGLIVFGLVYSTSQLYQDDDKATERAIMEDYLQKYVANNSGTVNNWSVEVQTVEGVLCIHSAEAESSIGTTSETEQNHQGIGSLDSTGIELEDLPAVERHGTI